MPLTNLPYGYNMTGTGGFTASERTLRWNYLGGTYGTIEYVYDATMICTRSGTVTATLSCRNPSAETYTFRARGQSPPINPASSGTVLDSQTLSTSPASIFVLTFAVTKLDCVIFTMQAGFNTALRYFQLNWQYA